MSIFSNPVSKKLFLIAGGVLVLGSIALGSLVSTQASPLYFTPEARSALEANNYSAFKEAVKKEATWQAERRAENLTEEKFKQIRENYTKKLAIDEALEKKDYLSFRDAVNSKTYLNNNRGFLDLKKVDTQEKFNKLVEIRDKQKEFRTKLNDAAKKQNKEQFIATLQEQQKYMDSLLNENLDFLNKGARQLNKRTRQLTETEIDRIYNKAVEMVKNGKEVDFSQGGLAGKLADRETNPRGKRNTN